MKIGPLRRRFLALTSALTLGLTILMASGSEVPLIPISSLGSVDDGSTIRTVGVVVEIYARDDGTENIVLVEVVSGATVKVVCSGAISPQPASYLHIGDEVEVTGDVYGSRVPRLVYTDSDRVRVLRACAYVLTVDSLTTCWQLFEGDEISVRGLLVRMGGAGLALRAFSTGETLLVRCQIEVDPLLFGSEVVVTGRLVFERNTLSVVLVADSVVGGT